MSVRAWALKPGELKPLSRAGLLLLAGRCALRVEPWVPPGAEEAWREGLAFVVDVAWAEPTDEQESLRRARGIRDLGARACNRLEPTDEPLGRCMNYAMHTLAESIAATAVPLGPALKKAVIDTAKYAASIPAVLAHAGRVDGHGARDVVEVASLAMWDAIRADAASLARVTDRLGAPGDAVASLRELAAPWPSGVPEWVRRAPRG
jgi:hypothetical protein